MKNSNDALPGRYLSGKPVRAFGRLFGFWPGGGGKPERPVGPSYRRAFRAHCPCRTAISRRSVWTTAVSTSLASAQERGAKPPRSRAVGPTRPVATPRQSELSALLSQDRFRQMPSLAAWLYSAGDQIALFLGFPEWRWNEKPESKTQLVVTFGIAQPGLDRAGIRKERVREAAVDAAKPEFVPALLVPEQCKYPQAAITGFGVDPCRRGRHP